MYHPCLDYIYPYYLKKEREGDRCRWTVKLPVPAHRLNGELLADHFGYVWEDAERKLRIIADAVAEAK